MIIYVNLNKVKFERLSEMMFGPGIGITSGNLPLIPQVLSTTSFVKISAKPGKRQFF